MSPFIDRAEARGGFLGIRGLRGRGPSGPSFSAKQIATAKSRGVDPKWVNSDGTLKYPNNDGFANGISIRELQPGQTFDRYGGSFVSPVGTPFEQRALPSADRVNRELRSYEVLQPLPSVNTGRAAPWFDQPGGGVQYQLPAGIDDLIARGYIRPKN